MKILVDMKSIMKAVEETEESRSLPFSMQIYLDDAAAPELREDMLNCFSTDVPNADVSFDFYGGTYELPKKDVDLALVAAGPSTTSAYLYHELLAAGYPTMVVTLCPNLLTKIASLASMEMDASDVVSPAPATTLPAENEPQPFDDAAKEKLHYQMALWFMTCYPEKRLSYASAFPFFRRAMSLDCVKSTAIQNAGIGFVAFIPGADMPLMTMNEAKMLMQIAAAYGQPVGKERLKELAAVVGSGFLFRKIARSAVGLVPALGWVAKAGVGYAGTLSLGYALIEYFEEGGDVSALCNKAAFVGRQYLSGEKKLALPSDFDEVKINALNAVGDASKKIVPIAKGFAEVLSNNGMDGDKVAKAAGFAVETVLAGALSKLR